MTRLHPVSAAVSALRSGGQLALFALFASTAFAGMGGDGPGPVAFLAVPGAFLVGAGAALARWYRFEYEVLSDRLVVRSGVVSRKDREIPLHRVQNVDVRRSILQRALGLATVTVETAGGGATEATLDAVGSDEADRLREELGRHGRRDSSHDDRESASDDASKADRAGTRPAATGPTAAGSAAAESDAAGSSSFAPESETLYELTGRRFATLCAVSFRPGAVIAPFVGASLFDDLLFDGGRLLVRYGIIDVEVGPGDVPSLGPSELLSLGVLGAIGFILVVWVVSAALTFVRYYGFRLERVGDELRYERGLLGRYSGTVPLSKVQTVTVSENAVMRRLGYASLAIETAGYAPGSGGGGGGDGGAETAVPLDTRSRVVALADDVRAELGTDVDAEVDDLEAPNDPDEPDDAFGVDTVERPPTRARRRYVARYSIAALVVTAVAVGVDRLVLDLPRFFPLLPLIGVALAPIAGHLTWANRGHTTVGDGFVTRTGVLRRHTRLVPYFRLQTVFVSRTVFQRRRNLASVVGDSASSSGLLGGDAVAYDLDAADADELREELLDRLEDDLAVRRRVRHDRRRRAEGAATEGEATPDVGSDPGSGAGSDTATDAAEPDDGSPHGPDSVATNGRGSGDEESSTEDGDEGGKDTEGKDTEGKDTEGKDTEGKDTEGGDGEDGDEAGDRGSDRDEEPDG